MPRTPLRAAEAGGPDALAMIRAVSERLVLTSAQLAVAREHGFAGWRRLSIEGERRRILKDRDLGRLRALLVAEPALASATTEHWCDHPRGARHSGDIAMLRFDARRLGLPRDLPGTGAIARALIEARVPVDGRPRDKETPLIAAASYGDAEVAQVLIEAGADVEARAAENAGGVPGGTALLHAAVFGMTEVIDRPVDAGPRVHRIEEAAGGRGCEGLAWRKGGPPGPDPRPHHGRRSPAAGRHRNARRRGDPRRRRRRRNSAGRRSASPPRTAGRRASDAWSPTAPTPACAPPGTAHGLGWCAPEHRHLDGPGHEEVEAILRPLTTL